MLSKYLIQQGYLTDVKRGVVNDNTALSQHLLEITQAEAISEIPANTLGDTSVG